MNDILMYGEVGFDIVARQVIDELSQAGGEPVTVRLNSGGGDVYEGIAILNALRGYEGDVSIFIESLAASAASFIAAGAGGRVVARPNAEIMVHRAWTMQMGNSTDLSKTIADLERQDAKLAAIYAERTGGTTEQWLERMEAETWFSAQEALDAGLVDAIEDAKSSTPAATLGRARVMASYKYSSRSAAPPPTLGSRSESVPETNQEKGDTVGILNQLAKELGKTPEDVQRALSGFFNETVTVSGEVEVTYPDETAIAPTERVTVEPTIGDTPAAGDEEAPAAPQNAAMDATGLGLAFAPGTVPEGWDFTVDEATGVVTAKAPVGVEVGDVVEATVKVNDTTDVPVSFKVRSLSDDGEDEGEAPAGDVPAEAPANAVVTVPKAVWDEYVADRAMYAAQLEADKARELEAKIDGHIRDGRYSAAHRGEALAAYKADPVAAERLWGALPKNKAVPVAELGHSGDMDNMTTLERMRAKAAANRKNKKKETKYV
ncbi:head maturation protease, ClpP-related [Corynebacterium accolens]|uniref:head maturation protease, ClpP-related n=1 Tax=Corynebacterium accolens TaxID=38284 RepID=UPI00223C5179|nr:head maturation protease, ClpP-related [Corynebacterium accolens]MCT1410036.1 ATP-dependent Clp protease proteolytic subunit [Corynebacterium accolens]